MILHRPVRLLAAALLAGLLLTACGHSSTPSGNSPAPAQSRDAMADALPVRLTKDFLTAAAAHKGYERYLNSSLIYTPLDQGTYGWAERHQDGSYGGFWEQMNATQREAALRSVTYRDTIRPETLRFTKAKFPDSMPATGSFSFYFTIQTTTGTRLLGWSRGGAHPDNSGTGVRGLVDRLTYDLTAS